MDTITIIDKFLIVLIFLFPGFIVDSAVSNLIPQQREKEFNLLLFKFLLYSVPVYLLLSPYIYIFYKIRLYRAHPILTVFISLLVVVLSSTLVGIRIAKLYMDGDLRKLFTKIGINLLEHYQSAWDYKFMSIQKEAVWVLVKMQDGTYYRGKFGSNSIVSTNPKFRDIYIEKVYTIDEVGNWEERKQSDGILIQGNKIQTIEFFYDGKDSEGTDK